MICAGVGLAPAGCQPPPTVQAVPPGDNLRESLIPKETPAEADGEHTKARRPAPLQGLVPAEPTAKGQTKTTPSGVTYETVKEGTGPSARAGQTVAMHYVGTLDDGREFDSTRKGRAPYSTMIGVGHVIKGWDEAVPGMKVGEVRTLTVPPAAGYGAQGQGKSIPPNATLHFQVELMRAD